MDGAPGRAGLGGPRRGANAATVRARSRGHNRAPARGRRVRRVTGTDVEAGLTHAEDALDRLLASLAGVDDAWCRERSRLPGWSRGHVLTHLARNADGLRGLAVGTAEGREVTVYGPGDAREAAIEAGASRSATNLVDDVRDSGDRLHAACRSLPAEVRTAVPEWRAGRRLPLSSVPTARVVETEVHRVDLGAGYEPADWPEASALVILDVALARLAALPEPAPFAVQVDGEQQPRGTTAGTDGAVVSGPAAELGAWLTGRADGSRLRSPSPLPAVPAVWS